MTWGISSQSTAGTDVRRSCRWQDRLQEFMWTKHPNGGGIIVAEFFVAEDGSSQIGCGKATGHLPPVICQWSPQGHLSEFRVQTLDNPHCELIGHSVCAMEDGQTATSHSLPPHTDTSQTGTRSGVLVASKSRFSIFLKRRQTTVCLIHSPVLHRQQKQPRP